MHTIQSTIMKPIGRKSSFPVILLIPTILFLLQVLTQPLFAQVSMSFKEASTYIDVHSHLFVRPSRMSSSVRNRQAAVNRALTTMNKIGIQKMIVMPPPFPPYHPVRYDFEELTEIVRDYPDRFACLGGGGTLNVMIQQSIKRGNVTEDLKHKFKRRAEEIIDKGALGFGELTASHLALGPRHNYQSAPPDHPLFLLLADIAARYDVPIDIHMEAVPAKMSLPKRLRFRSPKNPHELSPNIDAFERLLSHNRKAKIIWAHLGWDNTAKRTVELTGRLLRRHPNLYMSFKISPRDSYPGNSPIGIRDTIKQEWVDLIRRFPDRFVIGADQFYVPPGRRQIGPRSVEATNTFFSLLPSHLSKKVGRENPIQLFKLR